MFEPAWDDECKAVRCPVCKGTFHDEPEDYHRPDCPVRHRDEARALLAPLLDDPIRRESFSADDYASECLFCDTYGAIRGHAPSCPVNRKDELLGRDTT